MQKVNVVIGQKSTIKQVRNIVQGIFGGFIDQEYRERFLLKDGSSWIFCDSKSGSYALCGVNIDVLYVFGKLTKEQKMRLYPQTKFIVNEK